MQKGQSLTSHFVWGKGSGFVKIDLILVPPFSIILILILSLVFNSLSRFRSAFANPPSGVGGTNKTAVYGLIFLDVFCHQF